MEALFREVQQGLYSLLPALSGFGVMAIGLDTDNFVGKPSLECILFASGPLTKQVLWAPPRAYNERLWLMYGKVAQCLHRFAPSVALWASEPLTLALNEKDVCEAAGVRYEDDQCIVPPTNFATAARVEHGTVDEIRAPLDSWGRLIATEPFFNADPLDREQQMGVSVALLPWEDPTRISARDYQRSVLVTKFGWGLFAAGEYDPALYHHAAGLKQAAMNAEANNRLRTLHDL